MQKIDKDCHLSTNYFKWQQQLPTEEVYPKYSSSNSYYKDIVTQLLYCQKGLCAYTEQYLAQVSTYALTHWSEGSYQSDKPDFEGHLEHFDESKKAKKAATQGIEDWSWDNFFLVHSDINTKVKGTKPVDTILKPDAPNYDPFIRLAYNPDTNLYSPHPDLNAVDYERVDVMIKTLGLNYGPVVRKRGEILDYVFQLEESISNTTPYQSQFPTAYAMTKIAKNNNQDLSTLEDFL